ncbi:MAG TPA: hypothetical protein ENK54_09360 [Thiotrichales bacterium]|nr:hypothetical protein [Thiotrichales bacterium]
MEIGNSPPPFPSPAPSPAGRTVDGVKETGKGGGESSSVASDPERRQVEALERRDREVRAHEQAHLAAAGRWARGGATFETRRGPDGREYAVGGEVNIDSGPVPGDPRATLAKAQQIRAAALAPAQPSAQDRAVAARASRMEMEARAELATREREGAPDPVGGKRLDLYA